MSKPVSKSEQIWMALFVGIPIGFVFPLSEFIGRPGVTQTLGGALLGAIAAGLGMGLYYYGKPRSKRTRIFLLSVLILTFLTIMVVVTKNLSPQPIACEVCGYQSLQKGVEDCDICSNAMWGESILHQSYSSKEEWLFEEQMLHFGEYDSNRVKFYEPRELEGFKKDPDWKPSITLAQIHSYHNDN